MNLIKNILPAIEHMRVGGYWIGFFTAFLETTIGMGLILPGFTIILFLGGIDKKPAGNLETFNRLLAGVKQGDTILFLIDRGGTTIFVTRNVKQ